jgi:cytochrome d ubiquinol oxidase subunit I
VTGANGIPIGYGTLVLVYLGVAGILAWILYRFSRAPLVGDESESISPPRAEEARA